MEYISEFHISEKKKQYKEYNSYFYKYISFCIKPVKSVCSTQVYKFIFQI